MEITIYKNIPVLAHTTIAQYTENKAINVAELIQKYKTDLEEFGTFSVSNRESEGGRPQKIYKLNEQQATLLVTYLKNTPIVRKFKVTLVKDFYNFKERLNQKSQHFQIPDGRLGNAVYKIDTIEKEMIENRRATTFMHDYLIHNLKPKDPKRLKSGQKSYKTKLENEIERLKAEIKGQKAEDKKSRADFRIERDRANRLQAKLDRLKK